MVLFSKKGETTCVLCYEVISETEKRWKSLEGAVCSGCVGPLQSRIAGYNFFARKNTGEVQEILAEAAEAYDLLEENAELFQTWGRHRLFSGKRGKTEAQKFLAETVESTKKKIAKEIENNLRKENAELFRTLEISKVIGETISVDEQKKKWYTDIWYVNEEIPFPVVRDFSDIEEIYTVNGDKVVSSTGSSKKKRGVARAIVGGAIAGGAGAVVGTLTSKSVSSAESIERQTVYINILLKNEQEPISILCSSETVADSMYRELVSCFGLENKGIPMSQSPASQLREFKGLLDDGIISREEFDEKKKQLLDL